MNLPAVRPLDDILVCPATDDGIVAAMLMSRTTRPPVKIYFTHPFSLAEFFAYPAYDRVRASSRLIIAGYNEHGEVGRALRDRPAAETVWWSHHFWDAASMERVSIPSLTIKNFSDFETTSALLVSELDVLGGPAQIEGALEMAFGRTPAGTAAHWYYASLSARTEPTGVRRIFDPFYAEGWESYPSEDVEAEGRRIDEDLTQTLNRASLWSFPVAETGRVMVLPVPVSLTPYVNVLCERLFESPSVAAVCVLVDAAEQIILRLRPGRSADPFAWSRWVEQGMGIGPASLFDRLTVVAACPDVQRAMAVERLARVAGQGGPETL